MPACLSRAVSGEGVLETLSQLSRDIVNRIGQSEALRKPADNELSDEDENSDQSCTSMHLESGKLLTPPDSVTSLYEEPVTDLGGTGNTAGEIQVSLAGKGAVVVDGVVRVPVEITFEGVKRRLVVSIAIEPG
jgi:hypothetical protein